jgi:RNA polymerase sigma-70 factor, ECF subfamily
MEEALVCEQLGSDISTTGLELDDLDALVRVYRPRVLRYVLLCLRDKDLAETVTQDCFLRAFRARAQYRAECSVSTWLIKIATNLVRDQTRKRSFQFWRDANLAPVDLPEIANRLVANSASPEGALLAREKLARVWQIVDSLSAKQKSVFLLRFVEEMDIGEIALATGMGSNTIKSHLHRALSTIRQRMDWRSI